MKLALVPGLKNRITQARLMATSAIVQTQRSGSGVLVNLPPVAPDDAVSVIAIEVQGPLEIEEDDPATRVDGPVLLLAERAYLHNNEGARAIRVQEHGGVPNLGYWTDNQAWVEWPLTVRGPGRYEVWAELSVERASSRFAIGTPGRLVPVEVASTGSYHDYVERLLCTIPIEKDGGRQLMVKPDEEGWNPVNIRKLELRPLTKDE